MTTHFQKKKRRHALIMASLLSILAVIADLSGLFDSLERKTLDVRTRLCRINTPLPDDIVLILIDDASLQAMNEIAGRWPWPRYIHAELIEYLARCGAQTVVMDIMFFENQIDSRAGDQDLDPNDRQLAQATRSAGNVVHAMEIARDFPDESNLDLLDQPLPEAMIERFALPVIASGRVAENNVVYLPFEQLLMASAGLGVVSFAPDPDGVHRSEQLVFHYQGHYFPTHALAPILRKEGFQSLALARDHAEILWADREPDRIPLSPSHDYAVNMYGRYNSFSFSGVIESMMKLEQGITDDLMVSPEEFTGKIVYVGASAAATHDLKDTPIGNDIPGVFLHASICGNILTGDYLLFAGSRVNALILVPLLFVCVFCVLFMRKIYLQIYLPIGLALVYMALALLLYRFNLVIHGAVPLTFLLLSYLLSFTYISFTEGKEKRKVKNILGQYVSPAMLSQVLENSKDEYLKAEVGSKEYLTVFFSDIRGFTTLSERYPVETVVEVLNAYLSSMVDIIFEHNGTLDKFIGDAIVAFWGAPVRFDDHPYKAVLSAIQMMQALKALNRQNAVRGVPDLKIGIGIHTDHVILGNIGSRKKLDYTVIGDGVNLTSRLEGLTKTYCSDILISQSCHDHVKDRVCCRIADYVKVKGKDEPLFIYQVLGLHDDIDPWTRSLAEQTDRAFRLYCEKRFDEAGDIYTRLLETDPEDGLVRMFSKRCEDLKATPPEPDWSGCFVHTSK